MTEAAETQAPHVEPPQTLEGWYALHDIRAVDWAAWRALPQAEREQIAAEAGEWLASVAEAPEAGGRGSSAAFAVPGHKGDLMFLHLRPLPDDLIGLELRFEGLRLAHFLRRSYSYTSVTEMSQYGVAGRAERTPEQEAYIQRRLEFVIPPKRYVSFYPMSKRRGERENWYRLDLQTRHELMKAHGAIGRRYHGRVQQMITGSMGFDDWEWGVTLFADDAVQLKKIVQEMRYDEGSARYGEFGPFFLGVRLFPDDLPKYLVGSLPAATP